MKNYLIPMLVLVLLINCRTKSKETSSNGVENIRLNQIGYFINGPKKFVVAELAATSFEVIDDVGTSVYKGDLEDKGTWDKS